ncbi:28S ribosomal protein S24, mitochondrial [Schistocerca americana]|uniref:28S ribosomal protein S24, mitochondrial n=1 Tax=Schistocerca americana TaxID=7009 RepID=UPI001F4FB65A|nr:28S ribosomal protein S24, mitochondrial [Schistocerca americana]XP_047119694.1 28S ribosomal protein S24, mitochondrial [Schistocerca piceifrons]XP_049789194.1 28S ribosomal protein S24, mitochondrial [Schistocerca nitens]XP_049833538.1 28S ribosomal protein S24, mitochondrial [Schistocerca gregaria]XP_049940271.1 28S ribosomal protein S24, mitochondrial [Schistocerca serialis cubense]
MAGAYTKCADILKPRLVETLVRQTQCYFHITAACERVQAGRYRITPKRDRPLTYEMANPPYYIGHRKSWNSWNTSSLLGGLRPAETVVEDMFIRRFVTGTWHSLFVSEVIIKRQHNLIRIAGIVRQAISPRKMYFLIGYTEELLSYWLQCPVKLELQSVADAKDVVHKYI